MRSHVLTGGADLGRVSLPCKTGRIKELRISRVDIYTYDIDLSTKRERERKRDDDVYQLSIKDIPVLYKCVSPIVCYADVL